MTINLKEKLEERFKDSILEYKDPRKARVYVRVKPESLKPMLSYAMKELGFAHFSTVTGVDLTDSFEVLYHVFGNGIALTLAVKINRNDANIDTVTDIVQGAQFYEREMQDFFGIKVNNIPDGRRLIIPDVWPEGQYPLRKDWKADMLPSSLQDGLLRNWKE